MGQREPPADRSIVLVVEDEPLLRMMATDLIEEAGFTVVAAASADEAVHILETRLDIRIVFSDIDMPGSMDGLKLAAAIRDRWPPIEIILTSGAVNKAGAGLPDRAVFFPKPYSHTLLIDTLNGFAGLPELPGL
jgi:CheY-like chemotaxis protein